MYVVIKNFCHCWIEEACHPSPCGQNTRCEVINGTPTCSCIKGYFGNPISGCRHECESDHDCGGQEYCKDFKCRQTCDQCGIGANCIRTSNHRAVCECPKNYFGSPYTECRAECYGGKQTRNWINLLILIFDSQFVVQIIKNE